MKTHFKLFFLISLLMDFMTAGHLFGQVNESRKYRVIAYKAGNPNVFSVSNEVDIIPGMAIFIPNAFTPNGDGLNDTFGVSGEAIHDFSLKIYNRWGDLIYESSNPREQWDGTFMGEPVPAGNYIYKLIAAGKSGKRQSKEGSVRVVL